MPWDKNKTSRRPLIFALLAVLIVIGAVLGWPRLNHRYLRWDAKARIERAEQAMTAKDYQRAAMIARTVLSANPMDVNATRVIARLLDASGSPEAAQWRSRVDSLEPGNPENILAWAAAEIKSGDITTAERVLNMLEPAARENATCHAILAQICQARRETEAAAKHWAEAVRLDPQEPRHRLALGAIGQRSQDVKQRDEAIAMLTEMAGNTPPSPEAIRLLLEYALRLEDWKRADELSKVLVADSGATFADKLQRLSALRKINAQEAPGYLVALRTECLANPDDLYLLLMWMNQHDLAMMVSEWSRTLRGEIIGVPPVCVAVADAYARGTEWQRLREFLDARSWGEQDYLRRGFLARALERLDDAETGAQEWKDGIAAARSRGDSRGRLERMARLAIGWGWDQRAQEVMWSLAGSPSCPRWMLDVLWQIAIGRSDATQLQKLTGVLAQCDSKSIASRNTHAFYSLLVRSEDGDAHREAERLHQENPDDPAIAVTRALSLYQQGKTAEAVALTGSLPADELNKPQPALYHAIFLTAAGDGAKAVGFLSAAQGRKMFPEEKTILERARMTATRAAGEQEVAETSKAMRAAKTASDIEKEKAVEAARVARAAKVAMESEEARAKSEERATEAVKAAKAAEAAKNGVRMPVLAR